MCATRNQSRQPPLMRPSHSLTLRRPMVCTHSMVRTSKTSTPYSLYTVTWEALQPGADEAEQVSVEFHPHPASQTTVALARCRRTRCLWGYTSHLHSRSPVPLLPHLSKMLKLFYKVACSTQLSRNELGEAQHLLSLGRDRRSHIAKQKLNFFLSCTHMNHLLACDLCSVCMQSLKKL